MSISNKTKIVLIRPEINSKPYLPYGLISISNYLNEHNIESEIIDFCDPTIDEKSVLSEIERFNVPFIGVSAISVQAKKTEELIRKYGKNKKFPAIVLDMPLLIEVGWAPRCSRIIFVDCPQTLRYQRIREKGTLSIQDIKMRENFQISLDKKRFQADTIIDNNSDYSTLVRQVVEIFTEIVSRY